MLIKKWVHSLNLSLIIIYPVLIANIPSKDAPIIGIVIISLNLASPKQNFIDTMLKGTHNDNPVTLNKSARNSVSFFIFVPWVVRCWDYSKIDTNVSILRCPPRVHNLSRFTKHYNNTNANPKHRIQTTPRQSPYSLSRARQTIINSQWQWKSI